MNLSHIHHVLTEAKKITNHSEYVIIGSLTALGLKVPPPDEMVRSIDVDLYPKDDPARAGEVAAIIGQGSAFEDKYGYYVDAASPDLPTLPDGWENRFVVHDFGDVRALFLELNDAAISKYARGEIRDRIWIQGGLKAGLLSMPTIEYRLRETSFLDDMEEKSVKQRISEDKESLNLDLKT
ncbi:DUF6036 family nucleotidyltransferase [Polynucleobacter sp.]|uniref:DUF6036 family nucleotidyltransferase n=1 Tax=Polynucleobacter sp. TaxID=2029855 RepID=UPI0037C9D804